MGEHQVTTIRKKVKSGRVFCFCVCMKREKKICKNERKKQHIDLLINRSSFESIYVNRGRTPGNKNMRIQTKLFINHLLFHLTHLRLLVCLDCSNKLQKYHLYHDNYAQFHFSKQNFHSIRHIFQSKNHLPLYPKYEWLYRKNLLLIDDHQD